MIFNTWTFAIFALLSLGAYWTFIPQRFKPHYLVTISCVFYLFSVPAYLALIVCLGLLTYAISRQIIASGENPHHKRGLLIAGVCSISSVLFFFKYLKLFAMTANQVTHHNLLPLPTITVPLAISFFTFEFVHVLVDAYLGKIKRIDLLDFAVFTMFFPTLVAGPIKRYESFAPQARAVTLPSRATLALHLYRIVMGLAKKYIIADSMTSLAQPLLTPDANPYGRLDFLVAVLAYTAKIYFDFSGYSDIAIGVAGLLGFAIPENFDRPYWSENISIFWRRWHMSLSTWIRDYVFIPLGGSRRSALVGAANLLLSMALAGLWHGAAWTFVAWGVWHGLGLAAHRVWARNVVPNVAALAQGGIAVRTLSTITTFTFVALGWVLFAATSFPSAATVIQRAFF